jgi:hypothetical protein
VVAVPLALAVQRRQQQVGVLQRLQHPARPAGGQDRVTQRPRKALQHRRAGQELHQLRREMRQQLRPQVVGHEPVVPGEAEPGLLPAAGLDGERGQVQPDRPPLGPTAHLRQVRVGQPDTGTFQVACAGRPAPAATLPGAAPPARPPRQGTRGCRAARGGPGPTRPARPSPRRRTRTAGARCPAPRRRPRPGPGTLPGRAGRPRPRRPDSPSARPTGQDRGLALAGRGDHTDEGRGLRVEQLLDQLGPGHDPPAGPAALFRPNGMMPSGSESGFLAATQRFASPSAESRGDHRVS